MRRLLLLCFALLFFTGCGGGSAGTGLGTPIEGRVVEDGAPVANATVTILETGDATLTDSEGNFSITPSEELDTATVLVESNGKSTQVQIDPNMTGSIINVEIAEDTPAPTLPKIPLELAVQIVGACDSYFENTAIIRQSVEAPAGVICTAKATVTSEGSPIGGVRFAVQHRRCSAGAAWQTDAVSETSQKFRPGIGQVQFQFTDDEVHCEYRVTAPFSQGYKEPKQVLIETFTAQAQ